MIGYDLKVKIEDLQKKFNDAMKVFNKEEKKKRLDELEKIMSSSDFWNDPKKAQEITKEAQKIRKYR